MVKPAPDLNIEELERRLRSDDSQASMVDDPLAELTRLIESFDAPPPPNNAVVDLAARRAVGVAGRAPSSAPGFGAGMGLRGALPAEAPTAAVSAPEDDGFDELAFDESAENTDEFVEGPVAEAQRAPRRWLLRSLLLIALGVAAGGYYVYSKGGFSVAQKAPPTILAATTPAKVPPQRVETTDSADDATAILRKSQAAAPSAPAKIVGGQEQPVDVKTQLALQPPAAAPAATDGVSFVQNPPAPSAASPAQAVAAAAPPAASQVPAPQSRALEIPAAQIPAAPVPTPLAAAVANAPAPNFPAPTKQHSVVIRPDGSLVTDAKAPAPAAPATASAPAKAVADAANPAPQTSTPKLDISPKAPAKSVARVDAPKPVPAAPAASAPGAPLLLSPVAAEKPAKLAAKAADATAAAAPVAVALAAPAAPAIDAQLATPANPGAQADGAKGGWSAQLAAPHSQAEADAMVVKLQGKYADALGGAALSVHKADVNGTTVYRVRASGLAKASALDLCSKVQGAGGDCFTARN